MDGVRVLLGCDYNDGIGGTVFVHGLSEPVAAPHADRLVAIFGHMGARIVPVDAASPHGLPADPAPVTRPSKPTRRP